VFSLLHRLKLQAEHLLPLHRAHRLHPVWQRPERPQSFGDPLSCCPGPEGDERGTERVGHVVIAEQRQVIPAEQRLRQSGVRLADMLRRGDLALTVDPDDPTHDIATAETIVKYEGYLKRQLLEVERSRQDEERPIPQGFLYERIPGLSREMVQRFGEVEPQTLGQANRIPGVTPAAVALVGAYLERFSNDATGVQRPAHETGA